MTSHTYLDQGLTIFHTRMQATGPGSRAPFSAGCRPFITLSREACAGATTLGRHLLPLLDDQLGETGRSWMFLDKDLLTHALTQHHLPEHLANYLPEDRISEIKGMIGEIVGLHPPLWELEHRVAEAILQVAQLGRVIFAGRAAHLITRGLGGGLHLRLVASMATRIRRQQELRGCDEETARHDLLNTDRARCRYVQSNFEKDINDPHTYDLILNTDHLSPATAAQIVLRALQERVAAPANRPLPG
jgi:cytidylate kinase